MEFKCGYSLEYRYLNAGIQPVCLNDKEEKLIPLILSNNDVNNAEKLLNDVNEKLENISFDLFKLIVTGALVTVMKHGS